MKNKNRKYIDKSLSSFIVRHKRLMTEKEKINLILFTCASPETYKRLNYFLEAENENDIDLREYRNMAKHQAKYN